MGANDIHKLSPREKLELFETFGEGIRHRVDAEPDFMPLTEAQNAELDRRLDEMEQRDLAGEPWEEFLERVRSQRQI